MTTNARLCQPHSCQSESYQGELSLMETIGALSMQLVLLNQE